MNTDEGPPQVPQVGTSNRPLKRTYQACIACRTRKAKCIPAEQQGNGLPSCVRCQRERKPCVFSARRYKPRGQSLHSLGGMENEQRGRSTISPEDKDARSLHLQNGLNSTSVHGHNGPSHATGRDPIDSEGARRPRRSFNQPVPYLESRSGTIQQSLPRSPQFQRTHSSEAMEASETTFPGGTAARTQANEHHQDLTDTMIHTVVSNQNDALKLLFEAAEHRATSPARSDGGMDEGHELPQQTDRGKETSPETFDTQSHETPGSTAVTEHLIRPHRLSKPSQETLDVWEMFPFVRQEWLTAQEAVTYVDLFFENLAPLSPILSNYYSHHANHRALVIEEPVLCCTILAISTRSHTLSGDGGFSRSYLLHERLTRHVQGLFQRILWGQEKVSEGRTRNLGAVESFLLMTEWHARSLHIPPDIDVYSDIMPATKDEKDENYGKKYDRVPKKWLKGVVEPAVRSGRKSWTLLWLAVSLAHELELFEDNSEAIHPAENSESVMPCRLFMRRRRERIKRLLYVYMNEVATRIGRTSLIPNAITHVLNIPCSPNIFDNQEQQWHTFMNCWIDLTQLMKAASEVLFPSKTTTRELLRSGRYRGLLEHFQPLLGQWRVRYESISAPEALYDLLSIEFEYVRIYINSLALQAAAERKMFISDSPLIPRELPLGSIPGAYSVDYTFIQNVIDGSRKILELVLKLSAHGRLTYSPVRLFLRVTSASIFLLKALSLGVRNEELTKSLDLLNQSVQALRSHPVDDLHLVSRFASLLETHTQNLRQRFVRISVPAKPSRSLQVTPATPTTADINQESRQDFQRNGNGRSLAVDASTASADASNLNTFAEGETEFQDSSDFLLSSEDWLALPFDPSIAPFGPDIMQTSFGFDAQELGFFWNVPT